MVAPHSPLMRSPPPFHAPASDVVRFVLAEEVASLLEKQAIQVFITSPGFYGHLFVVPKSSGGWRPVLDLSSLNRFLRKIPLRMETAASIREAIRLGDWAASIDLSDAYFHILIHPRDRKWLRFTWNERVFQFRALPFGLSLAPWVFTWIARDLCSSLHSQGICLRAYLDDWLILTSSREQCQAHTLVLLRALENLGFIMNSQKSELHTCQPHFRVYHKIWLFTP